MGSFLFYRHGHLAETDIVVTLALTVAIFAIWRGFAGPEDRRQLLWFAISGIAIGVAGLGQGTASVCALLFLAAFTFTTRRWRTPLRWLISGAPLLAAAIGLSWWIYILRLPRRRSSNTN